MLGSHYKNSSADKVGLILLIKAIAGNNSVIDAMKVVSCIAPFDGLNPMRLLAPDGKRNSVDSWLFDILPTNTLLTLNPAFDSCWFKRVWVSNLLSDVTMYITVFAFADLFLLLLRPVFFQDSQEY